MEAEFDPGTYKADLRKAKATGGGRLEVKFTKALRALDAVNLYLRKTGTVEWRIGGDDGALALYLPCDAHGPDAPESLEARVRGVVGNAEVGLPSDAQTVLVS